MPGSIASNGKQAITSGERSSLLGLSGVQQEKQGRIIKAAFYGLQVFYSFFIMYAFQSALLSEQHAYSAL